MFPLGIEPYLIGGIIIGLGVSLIYIMTGLHATQSSFFTTTLSWFSKLPYFQDERNIRERKQSFIDTGIYTGITTPAALAVMPDSFRKLATEHNIGIFGIG